MRSGKPSTMNKSLADRRGTTTSFAFDFGDGTTTYPYSKTSGVLSSVGRLGLAVILAAFVMAAVLLSQDNSTTGNVASVSASAASNVRGAIGNNDSALGASDTAPGSTNTDADAEYITIKTPHGSIRIRLRPDLSSESVSYVRALVKSKTCTSQSCRLYRAEKPGILQGILKSGADAEQPIAPNKVFGKCPKEYRDVQQDCPSHDPNCGCHGPVMVKGDVGWAGGSAGGPDFFINSYEQPAKHWGNQHTVWGVVEKDDADSWGTIAKYWELPVKNQGGMHMLVEEVPFQVAMGSGGGRISRMLDSTLGPGSSAPILPPKLLMHLPMIALVMTLPLVAVAASAAPGMTPAYVDPVPLNTTQCLESIRHLPLTTYRHEHDPERLRIGLQSADVAAVLPEAVDILPTQIIPPRTSTNDNARDGSFSSDGPIVRRDVPIVNEQAVFLTGVGATQELIAMLSSLDELLDTQIDRVANLVGQVELLEELMTSPSTTDGEEELRMRAAAAEAAIAKAEMELEVARARDEEEYVRAANEAELVQMQRSEELTMQRLVREDEAARTRAEEAMRLKLEAAQKVEQARADSAEALSAIEHERALLVQKAAEEAKVETARFIAAAKAQAERENEGLYLRRLKAKMEQTRQKNIAIIHALAGHLASSMTWAAKHPRQVFVFVGYISLVFAAIFAAREAARLCRLLLEASIGKPRLVRETSCSSLPRSIASFLLNLFRHQKSREEDIDEIFRDVVLSDPLKERVITLAKAARNAKRHDAPYRNVLLYGLPGTGKTMVAKKLAQSTGMDFALMSGGDVGPLQADAVTQIHSLFRWAKMANRGLLLFIDEAEAFLGNRKHAKMSENAHNALNALLYHTGGERRDFLLVLATNRAEDLDEAVLDRCDESLLFGLPDAESRQRLITQYYEAFVKDEVYKSNELANSLGSHIRSYMTKEEPFRIQIDADVMDNEQLGSIVAATDGFSGREIGKLMIAVQANLYSSDDGRLTKNMLQTITDTKVDEHREKLRIAAGNDMLVPVLTERCVAEEDEDGTLRLVSGEDDSDDDEAMSVKELVEVYEEKTPDPQQARLAGRRALARAAASSSSSRPGNHARALFSPGSTSST